MRAEAEQRLPVTHRITNTGEARGRVLEIAYGYTDESDSQRLEDDAGGPLESKW